MEPQTSNPRDIPRATDPTQSHCYSESPPEVFRIRTARYLQDGIKYPPVEAMFELVGMEARLVPRASAPAPAGVLATRRSLVVRFVCPGDPDDVHLVVHWVERETGDHAWRATVDRLIEGDDDEWRRRRLKVLPVCSVGPWLIRKAVHRPALIALRLATTFRRSPGGLEVTVDIGSSVVACQIKRLVVGALSSLVLDLGFTLEGVDESELPERLLGGCRLQRLCVDRLMR
jgi:hypothetical protein